MLLSSNEKVVEERFTKILRRGALQAEHRRIPKGTRRGETPGQEGHKRAGVKDGKDRKGTRRSGHPDLRRSLRALRPPGFPGRAAQLAVDLQQFVDPVSAGVAVEDLRPAAGGHLPRHLRVVEEVT